MNTTPRLVLVTGIPGAGKTTVSHELAARFTRGVHLEADALHRLIVRGALWPNEEPHEEAMRQLELRADNSATLAANFFDAGFNVVIDDVIVGRDRLGIYERRLGDRPWTLVVLAPALEVALTRAAQRGYQPVGDSWAHLDAEQRAKLEGAGVWLDTTGMSVGETVEAVLAALPQGGGRGPWRR